MDFGEICEVVPWHICAHDCNQNLDAPQVAEPRAFKSHEAWANIPKGARYICVARDPVDAFVSFYRFLPAWNGLESGDITMEQFARTIFAGCDEYDNIWKQYLSWWEQRDNPNMLWVFFEDLSSDLTGSISQIAQWLGIQCDDGLLQAVADRSSFEFMSSKEQQHHFDDHFVRSCALPRMGLPKDTPMLVGKVRRDGGKIGSGMTVTPPSIVEWIKDQWDAVLAGPTGCETYGALRGRLGLHGERKK